MILKTEYREEFAGHAWRWEGEAFGNTPASGSVSVNLRFPGQYYDAETNLHYNHFRYYDPELGRYITSDPLGILPGLNRKNFKGLPRHMRNYFAGMSTQDIVMMGLNQPYVYVNSNPLGSIDPFGLDPSCKYYDTRCMEDGGLYYCGAAKGLCTNWPKLDDDGWTGCVRKCLQRKDKECDLTPNQCSDEGIDSVCNMRIHFECWTDCAGQ